MKKIFLIEAIFISFLMMLTASPIAMADMVTVYRVDGYFNSSSSLGEFTLHPSSGLQWVLGGYVQGKTSNIGTHVPSFQTFCIEYNESVDPYGYSYTAVPNDRAIYGGLSGQQAPGEDPISKGTAYLYHQFQNGTLDSYNYTPGVGKRESSSAALQQAIWWLEGEGPAPNNYFSNLVTSKFDDPATPNYNEAMADNNGQYHVKVLNLWDVVGAGGAGGVEVYGYRHQDLLVCDPVPEPATIFLLGSGLLGLAGLARRKFRK